jgi:glucose-6-phosphate isomerase, archaeal
MILTDLLSGQLSGANVVESRRTVGDLAGYWQDADAAATLADELLYVTQTWLPVADGTEGAILWGNTTLMPGVVGEEYFMTRGHWHVKRDRCEICITVSGTGALLLMDENRQTTVEPMSPGSSHYIPGHLAHRTVNNGTEPLVFLCAWPADCGHQYDAILQDGFSRRLLRSSAGR